jgi:hypothetical protein
MLVPSGSTAVAGRERRVLRGGTPPVGKFLLIAGWAFVGWHVFARYTLPA